MKNSVHINQYYIRIVMSENIVQMLLRYVPMP